MSTKQLQEKFGAAGLKGGRAEEWLFNKLNHVYDEVIDLREDWKAQIDGIDFGIKKNNWHNPYFLDCKGNLNDDSFFVEYSKKDQPGWLWKSKSDRIYHVDVDNNKALWYSLPEMQRTLSQMNCCIGPNHGGLCRIDANDKMLKDVIHWMW